MNLYTDLLAKILSNSEVQVTFPNLNIDPIHLIDMTSYRMLEGIKDIIEDDSKGNYECFMKIRRIVKLYRKYGCEIKYFRNDGTGIVYKCSNEE